jgi:uncharacterized membrane protein YqhA
MQNLSMPNRSKVLNKTFWVIIIITLVLMVLLILFFQDHVNAINHQLNNIRNNGTN